MPIHSLRNKPYWNENSSYQIEGLKDLINFLKFKQANLSLCLEIGSYIGESTLIFLSEPQVKFIYCVDTWDSYPNLTLSSMPFLEEKDIKMVKKLFYQNLEKDILSGRCIPVENSSENAFRNLDILFDVIYIDGSHKYEDVLQDLQRWYSKLKINGFICGHDFNFDRNSGFYSNTAAIQDFVKSISQYSTIEFHIFKDGSWAFQKQNSL